MWHQMDILGPRQVDEISVADRMNSPLLQPLLYKIYLQMRERCDAAAHGNSQYCSTPLQVLAELHMLTSFP